jgi:hypothetical protein
MTPRIVSIGLSSIVLLGMMCFVGDKIDSKSIIVFVWATLVFTPFYGFPPIVSIVLSTYSKKLVSLAVLAVASLLYGVWFASLVYYSFYVHPDPQSPLILIFVGVYFLPVLLPLWIGTHIIEKWHRIEPSN